MNKSKKVTASCLMFGISVLLSACSGITNPLVEKSTLKACQLEAQLFAFGAKTVGTGLDGYREMYDKSVEIANTAEDDVAIHFWYQSDFFKAIADPNTQSDWEPSQEMANSNSEIAKICQKYGITF